MTKHVAAFISWLCLRVAFTNPKSVPSTVRILESDSHWGRNAEVLSLAETDPMTCWSCRKLHDHKMSRPFLSISVQACLIYERK